ncbi:glycosyltransferase family 4 protein [Clostridium saudiense]|nr:glycosyltransferase family 4 protein [Clostridium saudiense]
MNLSIDGRGITLYNGSGIGTYTANLLRELITIDNKNEYTIFWAGDNYDDFKSPNTNIVLTSKKHGMFYENFYYPNYLQNNDIDLHHIPQNGIGLSKDYTVPCVVTIHDLIPYTMPETCGKGYLTRFLKDMPYIIENSKGILTVSEYSKRDILKFFPNFPEDKIFVTPLAANSSFYPMEKCICNKFLKNKYNIDFPFILYIGGFSSRKNVKELIISFKDVYSTLKNKYKLVLCGSIKDEGEKLKEFCKELAFEDKVIFTGFVPDEDLPFFYNGCSLFVYPSLYEGFGLPPLEAMSCKAPVITSNSTSIPEVTKDCALLIDPFNKGELSNAILQVLNSPSLSQELSEKGYENSKSFTWSKTAELTLKAYESIYNSINSN